MKNIREKYTKYLKKNIVLLVILLIVVCFSFGITYSNFIFESKDHRAVEMYVGKLNYDIKINDILTNKINVSSGNTVIDLKIKSLNKVATNFKLLYEKNDNLDIYYFGNKDTYGSINSNDEIDLKIYIVNKSNNNEICNFMISSGYITNSIDSISINENFKEINSKIEIGDYVNYKSNDLTYKLNKEFTKNNEDLILRTTKTMYRILNINEDGTIEIISDPVNTLYLKGSLGYNNIVSILNDLSNSLYKTNYSINVRNLNLEDIEKYTIKPLYTYKEDTRTFSSDNNIFIPVLWENEINSIINNINTNGKINRSENNSFTNLKSKRVDSASVQITNKVDNLTSLDFIDPIYYEIFIEKNNIAYKPYYLSTRYVTSSTEDIKWGILTVNKTLIENDLFISNGEDKEVDALIRPIIKLSNKVKINKEKDIWNLSL